MKLFNLLIAILVFPNVLHAQNVKRPNIILMMADDMGMGDTSAFQDVTGNHDHDQLHTPEMERLARMGVRFTDAHTPASRCSTTRYGLLTGRYPWRSRLKYWVLFGAQGDPLIEADRPTIATLLRDTGYRTGMVGKWHVGLRYRQSNGLPAAGFDDADLRMPLADSPLDHGFDFCRFTSRSHGTSGPEPGRKNKPDQTVGPGHIDGRKAIGATAEGRKLASEGESAYILSELGGRHSDNAIEFLSTHVHDDEDKQRPFFLYYPSNSNHSPHTPDRHVGDKLVAGASRNVAGDPMDVRSDYVYENDVALGRLITWLSHTEDPRNAGHLLIENTIVIFTSDNGAEKDSSVATGPFRSHKGSCYEGGHRVPFIISWPAGGIGDGNDQTPGRTSQQLLGLTDLFATFAEIVGAELPDNANGKKGAEDSLSMLAAMKVDSVPTNRPLFFNDHKEADDPAVVTFRFDSPVVDGETITGQWKLFFDAQLLRRGIANPTELYDLATDPQEHNNRIREPKLQTLVHALTETALTHRTVGGHRLVSNAASRRITFDWQSADVRDDRPAADSVNTVKNIAEQFHGSAERRTVQTDVVTMTVQGVQRNGATHSAEFSINERGLGISTGTFQQVDDGEAILLSFDQNVIVESVTIVAGNGVCGGTYRVGDTAQVAIYCVDADNDAKDQSGILSDIGVVKHGQVLRLDSSPHHGVEPKGRWRLAALTIRILK